LLKTKGGEVAALENLSATARARIIPIFHVCQEVKASFVPSLANAWSGMPAAVDGSFNYRWTGSANAALALIGAMRNEGISTMPCWATDDPPPHQNAMCSMVDQSGAMIKATLLNLDHMQAFLAWLFQHELHPSSVDLVLDLKHIGDLNVASFAGYIGAVLNQQAATLASFRSVTLASAAAPKDHGSLMLGANLVPRMDWSLWNAVRSSVPFLLDYGDYLTGHPDLTEPPGAAMAKATVSVRYTLDNVWLIIKGRQVSGQHGLPMTQQYLSHANIIANDPGFSGISNVWADHQIGQAAGGAPGMGSRAKWSGFAANRHMSLIADRLP
jgi:hypothetical protein